MIDPKFSAHSKVAIATQHYQSQRHQNITTLCAELWKAKPLEEQEFQGDCETKIISMCGVSQDQFEKALKVLFPEWRIFCIWESQADEF